MKIEYKLPLIAVKDVETSKKFYAEIFGESVALDLGWNVGLSSGFAIQQNFAWLTGLPVESVMERSHNMELYYEVDDFDAFVDMLNARDDIEYVNRPMTHDWKQRVVRIYDPDKHIIEIGESMEIIAKRYLSNGYSAEQTSAEIQHPIEYVMSVKNKYGL